MDMRARGIAAATAYLERIGNTIVASGDEAPAGTDIICIDEDTLVGALVIVRQRPEPEITVPAEALDVALAAVHGYWDTYRTQRRAIRVDVISILVLSEDRALLRHYRGERSG